MTNERLLILRRFGRGIVPVSHYHLTPGPSTVGEEKTAMGLSGGWFFSIRDGGLTPRYYGGESGRAAGRMRSEALIYGLGR